MFVLGWELGLSQARDREGFKSPDCERPNPRQTWLPALAARLHWWNWARGSWGSPPCPARAPLTPPPSVQGFNWNVLGWNGWSWDLSHFCLIFVAFWPWVGHCKTWLFYPFFILVLSVFYPCFSHILSVFYQYLICISSMFYLHFMCFIHVLAVLHPCFIHVLTILAVFYPCFFPCFIHVLPVFYPYFIYVLSIFYLFYPCFMCFVCFIRVLSIFHLCFIHVLAVFYPYFIPVFCSA